jgi:hypothetical protein
MFDWQAHNPNVYLAAFDQSRDLVLWQFTGANVHVRPSVRELRDLVL